VSRLSGCDRILALLADGREHGHLELYRLGTVAHSRVSDLRRRGYVISMRRHGDDYLYQLVSRPRRRDLNGEILGFISRHGSATMNATAKAVHARGFDVRQAIEELVAAGSLVETTLLPGDQPAARRFSHATECVPAPGTHRRDGDAGTLIAGDPSSFAPVLSGTSCANGAACVDASSPAMSDHGLGAYPPVPTKQRAHPAEAPMPGQLAFEAA
jgi:hypothetical protein